jgi:sarcosine oxidase, subunit gamma
MAEISIAPLERSARFSLRMRATTAAEAGLDMPINTCAVADDRITARLGPDEWLLLGPQSEASELERRLTGKFFSLVDISHRNVAIAVAGTHAREVINAGCPLDLHDDVFGPGSD